MQQYSAPDLTLPAFRDAPDASFVPAPADGVLPENFFATTNLPTYVKVGGHWRLPRYPRMDSAIVAQDDGSLVVLEGRYVKAGMPIAIGYAEDGSEGIYVNAAGFLGGAGAAGGEFQFMSSNVSREKPVDYAGMAELLETEKRQIGRAHV